ncbi:MAG: DUF2784 domain-containing protein [Acidobacteriota bacterium]|nr:DUF2784 domain-containing protein [Acidobacteriota bacterium]
MLYRLFADLVLIVHFCFVLFIVFGGLLILRRPKIAWLHVPAVVWGILIEFFWWTCPLTTLENYLRGLGGESGYESGFIDYFVSLVLYSPLSPATRFALGFLLIGFNLFVYWKVFYRARKF